MPPIRQSRSSSARRYSRTRGLSRRQIPSPTLHPAAPPFLICHGDKDPLVIYEQSILLHQALQKAGCPSTLVLVPGAGHGFQGEQYREMVAMAREFFINMLVNQ